MLILLYDYPLCICLKTCLQDRFPDHLAEADCAEAEVSRITFGLSAMKMPFSGSKRLRS